MLSFASLCTLLGLGYIIRQRIVFLQRLYLPASVIAGLLGLLLIQLLPMPEAITLGWSTLPSNLINIVFASLFLGLKIPTLASAWNGASRQLAYGQIVAWGQYAVGCALTLLLLKPVFSLPDIFVGIMPIGFEGGHGTAAGMGPVFDNLGFPEMKDFALASATGGLISAILIGIALVNWAIRRGYVTKRILPQSGGASEDVRGIIPLGERPAAGRLPVKSDVIESLSLQLIAIGFSCLLGWFIKEGLLLLADQLQGTSGKILRSFPLFPLCMLGGVIVQKFSDRFDPHSHIDRGLVLRLQNGALDFLIVAAIATIQLDVVARGWLPLLIIIFAGIVWNLAALLLIARHAFRDAWFERAIAELGQSMGVTATGLLLLRTVDPDYETPAAEAFACKQLLHEPFMGGGLWTGAAIPLLALWGGWPIFGIAISAMTLWSIFLFVMNRRDT